MTWPLLPTFKTTSITRKLDEYRRRRIGIHYINREEQEYNHPEVNNLEEELKDIIDISEDDLDVKEVISSSGGTCSVVYQCLYKGHDAIMRTEKTGPLMRKKYCECVLREAQMMKKFDHPNIQSLIGCFLKHPRFGYIFPFISYRAIQNQFVVDGGIHLEDDGRKILLTFEHRLKILLGVSRGMQYLYENFKIVDLNLEWHRILLTEDLNPVIIYNDGGYYICGEENNNNTNSDLITGDSGYNLHEGFRSSHYDAPELVFLFDDQPITSKCDVYTFGIMIYQLMTCESYPYGDNLDYDVNARSAFNPEEHRPPVHLRKFNKGDNNEECMNWIIILIKNCWSHEPNDRPSFKDISMIIEENLEGIKLSDVEKKVKEEEEEEEEKVVEFEKNGRFKEKGSLLSEKEEDIEEKEEETEGEKSD